MLISLICQLINLSWKFLGPGNILGTKNGWNGSVGCRERRIWIQRSFRQGSASPRFYFSWNVYYNKPKGLMQEHICAQIGKYGNLTFAISNSWNDLSFLISSSKMNLTDSLKRNNCTYVLTFVIPLFLIISIVCSFLCVLIAGTNFVMVTTNVQQ